MCSVNWYPAAVIVLVCLACDRTQPSLEANEAVDGPSNEAGDGPSADVSSPISDSALWTSPKLQIGKVSGEVSETFGRIRDVAIDDNGDVLILDDQALMIHWFSENGTSRGSAGRAGGAPGEFRAPVGVEVDHNGNVLVADMAHRRVSVFSRSSTGLVLDTTYAIPLHALDFCVLGDRLYLLAPDNGLLIHEVDQSGRVKNSFAPPAQTIAAEYTRHAALLTESYARGRLRCSESPAMVLVVHEHLPDVRAFTPEGVLVWSTQLQDYRRLQWELVDGGGGLRMRGDPETGTSHTARYLGILNADTVVVTLSESGLENPDGQLSIRLLSLTDGKEFGEWNTPVVLAGVHAGRWYGYRDLPYPALLAVDAPE